MPAFLSVLVGYGIFLLFFYWLSKDAERHNIYLSRTTKIMFLLTFTAPFVIIWYIYKRVQRDRDSQLGDIDNSENNNR